MASIYDFASGCGGRTSAKTAMDSIKQIEAQLAAAQSSEDETEKAKISGLQSQLQSAQSAFNSAVDSFGSEFKSFLKSGKWDGS